MILGGWAPSNTPGSSRYIAPTCDAHSNTLKVSVRVCPIEKEHHYIIQITYMPRSFKWIFQVHGWDTPPAGRRRRASSRLAAKPPEATKEVSNETLTFGAGWCSNASCMEVVCTIRCTTIYSFIMFYLLPQVS